MKNRNYLAPLILIAAIVLLFSSCQKGDAGPAGPTGAAGAAGPQGPKGDTGTANVIYSSWLDVTYTPDTLRNDGSLDTIGYYAAIPAVSLTSSILSNGEMKIYMNLGTAAAPDVVPLPYSDIYSGLNVSPEFYLQKITLYANANLSTTTQNGSKYLQYRYILVPGGVASQSYHPINWGNYNAVKVNFGLN